MLILSNQPAENVMANEKLSEERYERLKTKERGRYAQLKAESRGRYEKNMTAERKRFDASVEKEMAIQKPLPQYMLNGIRKKR